MDALALIGIFVAIDGVIVAIFTGVPRLSKWVNDNMISALASFLVVIGVEIFLFVKLLEPISADYDFEGDIQGWAEHAENKVNIQGPGVSPYKSIKHTGDYSLQFFPSQMTNSNAYVTVRKNVQTSIITAYVFVPPKARVCTPQGCSTAKIIVWGKDGKSYESENYVELNPGSWELISLDLSDKPLSGPLKEFGIHFYLLDYKGPLYVDSVTLGR